MKPYHKIKTTTDNYFVINPLTGKWSITTDNKKGIIDEIEEEKEHKFLEDKLDMIILNTTKKCNLGCIYCSNGEKETEDMNISVGKKVIERVEEYNPSSMRIVFHGNEPLLNFKFIKQFSYLARRSKTPFRLSLQTNGTVFTKEILDYLKNQAIEVSFSMDGKESEHNLQRPYKNSEKGTFKKIQRDIKKIREFQNYIAPITVVTKHNVKKLPEIYSYYKNKNYDRVQFTLVQPLGYASTSELIPDQEELFQSMKKVIEKNITDLYKGSKFKVRNLTTIVGNFFQASRPLTCTSCGVNKLHPLAIDIDGTYYPCDTLWEREDYRLGNIYTDSILETITSSNNPRNATKQDVSNNMKYPFFRLHANGCPAAIQTLNEKGPYMEYYEKIYHYIASNIEEYAQKGIIEKVLE
ncbi:MAG: radical SAM protein [Nanobdellota archaeon]